MCKAIASMPKREREEEKEREGKRRGRERGRERRTRTERGRRKKEVTSGFVSLHIV
jgi:hypothetical protein